MKKISLTQGKFALVDDEDFEFLNSFKWHLNGRGYPITNIRKNKRRSTKAMHRFLMGDDIREVDHINLNKLDNRKSNLRLCSRTENVRHVGLRKDNKNGFKGVYPVTGSTCRWQARIRVDKKAIHLGVFSDQKSAALAYNQASRKFHGEFGVINNV